MKQYFQYFWVSSTFVLLAIISVLAGFTADGINFKAYTPWLSIKCALFLSLIVLVLQIPPIFLSLVSRYSSNEGE
ncbi:hypothetical protein AT48_00647 [Streptococcus equi subsp. zooepidemicus SzAM60]|nr:hypothetical protein AT48_00647 [Streptococcus equi subsp. zooepidemicus SzAM60]